MQAGRAVSLPDVLEEGGRSPGGRGRRGAGGRGRQAQSSEDLLLL